MVRLRRQAVSGLWLAGNGTKNGKYRSFIAFFRAGMKEWKETGNHRR